MDPNLKGLEVEKHSCHHLQTLVALLPALSRRGCFWNFLCCCLLSVNYGTIYRLLLDGNLSLAGDFFTLKKTKTLINRDASLSYLTDETTQITGPPRGDVSLLLRSQGQVVLSTR